MAFVTGPLVSPAPRTGQVPIDLMEGLSPAQAASLVPFVKIIQLDPRTGREVTGTRPLMYDLIQTPQFGSLAAFGNDPEAFRERGLVSLTGLRVQTQMEYGFISYSKVALEFTVHQPRIVLDRGSDVQWRALLEEGTSFSMEYGWRADRTIVFDNPVFNGEGFEDQNTGQTIRPTRTIMLAVVRYNLHLRGNGEIDVSIEALENGDIALRETRLIDVVGPQPAASGIDRTRGARSKDDDDVRAAAALQARLKTLGGGSRKYYTMRQLLGELLYPLISEACSRFGYDVIDMFVGNFNADAGIQSKEYGGQGLAGRSIGDFQIPIERARDLLTFPTARGVSLRLHDILSTVIGEVNSFDKAWREADPSIDGRPNVALQARTIRQSDGVHLVLTILDRKEREHALKGLTRIPLGQQSRANVFDRLLRQNIPIIEFGRGSSLILESSFSVQPDPLFQSILVDRAYRDRKDREEITSTPDVETRRGTSRPQEVIPLSILDGSITFLGNFIFETYGAVWIEYFGASSISGIFHVLERTDVIEPGKFTTEVRFISEGIDPLNVRRKLTDQELSAQQAAADALKAPKKPSR